jgi:microcin C transport system substrate-binding protein
MRLRFAALLACSLFPLATVVFPAGAETMPAVPQTEVETAELGAVVHRSHAIAMHGEPKYPPDFAHFDYVNPDAPKGGTVRFGARGTFDSFNDHIPKGAAATGLGYLSESLMVASADEPFTQYGLIAEDVEWPEDRSWVTFTLRPEARWHDGKPITVEDVIWTFETLKEKGSPGFRFYYASVSGAEKVGERRVKFSFTEAGNRELPLIVSQLTILPKHYWEGRDFEKTTLEPPLGSGPYRIARFEAGRFIEYERVEDYWAKDLPVNRGSNNFDRLRFDYFRDDVVIREALKSGDLDYRDENQAKSWALDYDVPAVRGGLLNKVAVPHQSPTGMQAFAMNTRRDVFQDPRVRQALAYAFDFEWTNRNMFFGQYTRTESYFSNWRAPSSFWPRPAGWSATSSWSTPRPASPCASRSCCSARPSSASSCPSRATSSGWGSMPGSAWSTPRSTSTGSGPSIST